MYAYTNATKKANEQKADTQAEAGSRQVIAVVGGDENRGREEKCENGGVNAYVINVTVCVFVRGSEFSTMRKNQCLAKQARTVPWFLGHHRSNTRYGRWQLPSHPDAVMHRLVFLTTPGEILMDHLCCLSVSMCMLNPVQHPNRRCFEKKTSCVFLFHHHRRHHYQHR